MLDSTVVFNNITMCYNHSSFLCSWWYTDCFTLVGAAARPKIHILYSSWFMGNWWCCNTDTNKWYVNNIYIYINRCIRSLSSARLKLIIAILYLTLFFFCCEVWDTSSSFNLAVEHDNANNISMKVNFKTKIILFANRDHRNIEPHCRHWSRNVSE